MKKREEGLDIRENVEGEGEARVKLKTNFERLYTLAILVRINRRKLYDQTSYLPTLRPSGEDFDHGDRKTFVLIIWPELRIPNKKKSF